LAALAKTTACANSAAQDTKMLQFADLKTQGLSLQEQFETLWGRL
jgi:hypothetical protein